MNDIGYLSFNGSECEAAINTADKEDLRNLLQASEGAIGFHTKEQNLKQIKFFESARN